MVGILHYMKLSGRVSPACRGSNDAISPIWWCDHRLTQRLVTLMSCNFPHLVVQSPPDAAPGDPHVVQFPPFGGGEAAT